MEKYMISGIQQVGVGTVNFRKSWDWYIQMFGMDIRILEDDTVAERMLPYTGGKAQRRHACIAVNLQGGGGFEIWQYAERKPQACPFEISAGDLGIFAAKVKCLDVKAFQARLAAKWDQLSPVESLPDGTPCFWVKDPWGNLFQLLERKDVFINEGRLCGGIAGAVVGVSDMDRSVAFYREVLGYDRVLSDTKGSFSDFVKAGGEQYRRVLLGRSKPFEGAFSPLMGESTIELVQMRLMTGWMPFKSQPQRAIAMPMAKSNISLRRCASELFRISPAKTPVITVTMKLRLLKIHV